MIGKFISSLLDNGKKLLAVTLIFVVVALFDRLLIGPTMSRMAAIDQDIAKEENLIKQDLHFLGYKNKILKEAQVFESYVVKNLPGEEEIIAGFLKKLEMLANKAGVTLIKVTPSTGTQEKEYLKYRADLECSGKLADVVAFMHLVGTSSDLMKVVKFSFSSKKSDSDEIKAVLTVDKIIVGKRPAVVSQTQTKTQNSAETGLKSVSADNATTVQTTVAGQ